MNFQDINECLFDENPCGINAKCINQYGSYTCECLSGFIPSYFNGFQCEDYDECSESCNNDCDSENARCINLTPGFQCICKHGFYGTGKKGQCFDIDECKQVVLDKNDDVNHCHEYSTCTNTIGSFECKCINGFSGNGTFCEGKKEIFQF